MTGVLVRHKTMKNGQGIIAGRTVARARTCRLAGFAVADS